MVGHADVESSQEIETSNLSNTDAPDGDAIAFHGSQRKS